MLLGADPEFIVLDYNNNPVNAIKCLKNNKTNPILQNKFYFFHDNVLAEFNFPPAPTEDIFVKHIKYGLQSIQKLISPYKICFKSAVEFYEPDHKNDNFFEVGCDPDINAYTLKYNKTPEDFFKNSLERFAGGHIHVGGNSDDAVCDSLLKPIFVYMMDLFVGIPSVILDQSIQAFRRKKVYGQAGTYRPKSYGIEYRVLSPFWLSNPTTTKLIYRLCEFVFNFMNSGNYERFWHFNIDKLASGKPSEAYECYGYDPKGVAKAINNNDIDQAKKYMYFISNFMPEDLFAQIDQVANQNTKDYQFNWAI